MALDLETPDRTIENVPDGGSGINEGMSHDLEGFEVCFVYHDGGRLHRRCN